MFREKHEALLAGLRSTLDDNVRLLMDYQYRHLDKSYHRVLALEKDSRVSRSTIYRLVPSLEKRSKRKRKKEIIEPGYPGIDKVVVIARVLGCSAAQLLTQDYANQYLVSLGASNHSVNTRKSSPNARDG